MSDAMNGKIVAITGATEGIGFYSALEIAGLGAEVIHLLVETPNAPKKRLSAL